VSACFLADKLLLFRELLRNIAPGCCFRSADPYVPEKLLLCVRDLLLSEPTLAGKFVHSILEHLNWSFSEFIGQLQEVWLGGLQNYLKSLM